jgi:hypothetical protein
MILVLKNHLAKQHMFGLFKKKSEKEKLQDQYKKLLEEAHKLSTTNRKMSDQKAYEADEIMKQIEKLA